MHWLMVNDISMDAIVVCAAMVSPVSSSRDYITIHFFSGFLKNVNTVF